MEFMKESSLIEYDRFVWDFLTKAFHGSLDKGTKLGIERLAGLVTHGFEGPDQ